MDDVLADLRDAFEAAGYDVNESSVNRDRVRISVLDAEASAEDLQSITYDVLDESDVMGLDVTTESLANEEVTTVVSFRYRG